MSEWKNVTFESLSSSDHASFAIGPFGSKVTTNDYTEQGVPFIRGINLANGVFHDDDFVFISEGKADEIIPANVTPGDLVFTRKGTIGQVSMIPRNPRFSRYAISGSQVKARLNPDAAIPEFYYYWFTSPRGRQSILAHAVTTGVPSLANSLTTIKNLQVPLLPVSEQRAIANALGALDNKISANERITETSLDLAEKIYLKHSTSPDWRSTALDSAAKWLSGGTPKTNKEEFWGGNIPWISAKSLKSPMISKSERNLTTLGAQSGTRMVGKDSVIFVVRGSSLKEEFRVGITQRDVAFGQDCKALVAHGDIEPHTLFHAIRSRTPEILNMVDETGIGAGRLSTDLISKLEIRVPSSLGNETSTRLRLLDEQAANSQSESRTLAELRDTLLPQLMSGKLRIKDAEKMVEDNV
ncbi:restriction endonuclease subunit S [Nocardiopsis sp. CT-R113]|uniref:Restriction endonuclease subunit S n=1 Tax=Nocardiopsis codii TaxID=3065942 RepID=A0ABU7K0L5_9ACTN|nr:restriction endonuclease subunit S [Nocardiopsis sp. CT-R113]MEE2035783.1 restriction endonuclease subunit S [Nocardiopsis sp. CT-R113]